VTIGSSFGHFGGADGASGSAFVFNHELLANLSRELGCDVAGGQIGECAWRERHHDANRLCGPLRSRDGREQG
jgi:hypothetical protein